MEPAPLAALYNAAPIILWVEDLLTARYLDAVWQNDSRIQMYVGGGHETLEAVAENAYRMGRRCVFSLRDRDFGPSNRSRWTAGDTRKFALDTFEVECFLCDSVSLSRIALNTSGRTEAEIGRWLTTRAHAMCWWMACRKVISALREARQEQFWTHPKRAKITSQADAEAVLLSSDWVSKTVPALPGRVTASQLQAELAQAHKHYEDQTKSGSWIPWFSCKELLEEMVSWIYTINRPAGFAGIEDLAKAVAHQQLQDSRVPQELIDLKAALLLRVPRPTF